MSEDIKKYKQLVESSFMTEASPTASDPDIVEHTAKLLVDLIKDGLVKGDHTSKDLRDFVNVLKELHDDATIEHILNKAHEISKQSH